MKAFKKRGTRKLAPRLRGRPMAGQLTAGQLNVGEAKALFSSLVDRASRGEQFVIAKAGTPVARIGPLDEAKPKKVIFGTMKGLLSPEDEKAFIDAIEAPLPDDVLASFYGGGPLEGPE